MRLLTPSIELLLALSIVSCTSRAVDEPVRTHSAESHSVLEADDISSPSSRRDSALFFLNINDGWFLRNGSLYITKDGGNSWGLLTTKGLANCKSVVFTT